MFCLLRRTITGELFSQTICSTPHKRPTSIGRFVCRTSFGEVIPLLRIYIQGLSTISLNKDQIDRYQHQLSMPGMTVKKQERLISSKCLLIAGDTQLETTITHLIDAGIGHISAIGDSHSLNALRSAASNHAANSDVSVEFHELERDKIAESMIEGVNLVVEASLDWQFKLRLCDFCMRLDVPMIHSGASGLRFQLFTMVPGKSACLRCAFPLAGIDDFPITPVERATFSPIATCAGAFMALESIKLLANLGVTQGNEFWKIDGLSGEIEIIRGLDPQRDCPDCGQAMQR